MDMRIHDYYEILGIPSSADQNAIREAYRDLAKRYHPDKNPGFTDAANAKLAEINRAYAVLSNPDSRTSYDSKRKRKYADILNMGKDASDLLTRLRDWGVSYSILERIIEQFAKVTSTESERDTIRRMQKRLSNLETENENLRRNGRVQSKKISELVSEKKTLSSQILGLMAENLRLKRRSEENMRALRDSLDLLSAQGSELELLESCNTELELCNAYLE